MALPEGFRRTFFKNVSFPLLLVLLLTLCAAAASLWLTSRQINANVVRREQETVRASVAQRLHELAVQQYSITAWPPLYAQLIRPTLDRQWLDENVGGWLYTVFHHQQVYLLNARRQGIYAAIEGLSVSPQAPVPLLAQAARLIDAASRLPANTPLAARDNHVSLTPTRKLVPRGFAAFARIAGQPVVIAVSPVRPPASATGPVSYLLSVVPLDAAFINDLSNHHLLNPLNFSDHPPGRRETALTLVDPQGQTVSFLRWRPQHPGAEVLRAIWPVIPPLAILLLGVIAWMMRAIWRSALRLRQTLIALQASEAQALHVAYHDVLTGLPNRAMLDDRLAQALAYTSRQSDCVALLALDLDRFKQVNDSLGHHGGDALIKAVATRLCGLVREGDVVARTGGDEFLILLRDVKGREAVRALGLRIIDAVKQPFALGGRDIFIGVSIGVALAPADAIEKEDLKRKADIALYAAKARGRDGFQWFEQSLDESLRAREALADDLRAALQHKDTLTLHFLPQVDITGEQIVGFEAQLRWQHPQHRYLSSSQLLRVAEESGLSIALGEWMLTQSCRVAQQWPDRFIAVSITPVQFYSPDFVERAAAILQAQQCDPSRIELGINESVLFNQDAYSLGILLALRASGFTITVENFGVRYASIRHLNHFPVDKIKIDPSFIQHMGQDDNAAAIVESVIRLGHAMGVSVTARGVDSEEKRAALEQVGCNELQGPLFSKALSEASVATLLSAADSASSPVDGGR